MPRTLPQPTRNSMSLDNAAPEVHAVQSEVRPAAERAREHDAAARDPVDPLEVFELIRGIQDPEHPHTLDTMWQLFSALVSVAGDTEGCAAGEGPPGQEGHFQPEDHALCGFDAQAR